MFKLSEASEVHRIFLNCEEVRLSLSSISQKDSAKN